VELVPGASKGLAIVSLSSNGRTWGQIEIRRLSGGRVSWNTVDIVRGYSAEFVHTKRFVVPVANFPSLRAIHPGTNTLRLSVQQAGGLRIARVSAPRSVFLATPLIPQPLEIGASVGNLGTLSVGDTVDVPYLVRNKNPTPLSTVHLETTNTHGVVAGVSNRLIDTLTKTQHGVVTVKLLREGEATFDLVAYTESARDAVRVELDVDAASPDPQSHGNTLYWGVATAVGVLIALECIWLIARMIRRRVS
jgi:hypothetical protein